MHFCLLTIRLCYNPAIPSTADGGSILKCLYFYYLLDYFSQVLTNKLLHLIERSSDIESTQSKYVVNDVESQSVFDKDDELIQFQDVSNILVTSTKPVQHEFNEKDIPFIEIPDLYPVKHTITLPKEHFYGTSKYRKYELSKYEIVLEFNCGIMSLPAIITYHKIVIITLYSHS